MINALWLMLVFTIVSAQNPASSISCLVTRTILHRSACTLVS